MRGGIQKKGNNYYAVVYASYGPFADAVAGFNRIAFATSLPEWLDAIPTQRDALRAGATAIDLGCGHATIALASLVPTATIRRRRPRRGVPRTGPSEGHGGGARRTDQLRSR